MSNINTINKTGNSEKSNGGRNLGYVLMLAGLLNASSPTYAQTNNYNTTTEQVTPQANKLDGIKLPTIYQNKLDDFLANNTVMNDKGTKTFTINFVEKEMESNRGISKENQLLYIRHAIYKQVTDKDLYDGQDGNQKIAENFSNKTVSVRIKACGQKYRNGALAYINQRSADAQQRSANARQRSTDAQQRSADAIKEIMKQDSTRVKERMVEFYDIYIKNPNNIKQDDLIFMKESTKEFISDCKKRGINYRTILLKKIGDEKKVDKILKFYGVE